MRMRLLVFLSLLCSLVYPLLAQQTPKVLIIGIDGCRPDALQAASTPNIDLLIANATYSFESLTEAPTWSGVGWSGMLTGVWRDKHGVSDNSFSGSNFAMYPHFFNNIEDCNPSLVTASIVHWGPINSQIVDIADYTLTVSSDLAVSQETVTYLNNNDPDALFIHFDDVDHAGHNFGFSPNITQYTDAITQTDIYIGTVIAALENRSNYANEDWIIILSTDHGGTLSGHGGASVEERTMFTIFSGDRIPNEQRSKTVSTMNISDVLSFNGVDQYIDIPADPFYDFGSNQDFTIECWVKINSIIGDPVILSNKDWVSGYNHGFVFSFPSNGPSWKVNIGDDNNRRDITGGAIVDGNWHHLAVSFDRDGQMKMYEDGSFVRGEDISGIGNINSGLPFAIGQDGTHTYGDWFDGEITEVRLWKTVLEESVISSNACISVTNMHPNFSDLIGYWQINDGSGMTVLDASFNNNNGTIEGASPIWLADPNNLVCNDYSTSLRIVDVSTTALEFLCGSINPIWGLDGQSVPFIPISLPVELLHFNGEAINDLNRISWSVALEEQIKKYIIERSDGPSPFEKIGMINPTSSQSNIKHYEFLDQAPFASFYYRLKFLNADGSFDYSNTIFIERASNRMQLIKLQPIPVIDELLISYELASEGPVQLSIYNSSGQLIKQNLFKGNKGLNEMRVDFKPYPNGSYIFILKNDQKILKKVIVKQ